MKKLLKYGIIAIILIIAAIGYFIYSRIEQKFEKDET